MTVINAQICSVGREIVSNSNSKLLYLLYKAVRALTYNDEALISPRRATSRVVGWAVDKFVIFQKGRA